MPIPGGSSIEMSKIGIYWYYQVKKEEKEGRREGEGGGEEG